MSKRRSPAYVEYDGFRLSEAYLLKCFRFATTFVPEPDDIVVATYPKCGTTWMCQIVKLILDKGEHFSLTPDEYFKHFPFWELYGEEGIKKRLKPGCIKTHLPFNRLNFSEKEKYIYVTRHPRDCVVSFYHHTVFFPGYRFSDGTFDDFFQLFIEGKTDCNDYFDNLLSWYEQRNKENVFFTTYESMKADPKGTIINVASFLGCSLTSTQVDQVLKCSSIENMKKDTAAMFEQLLDTSIDEEVENRMRELEKKALEDGFKSVGEFVRKGQVGDGSLHLSERQEMQLKERILEKTKDSDVMSLWSAN